jgi:hypothetical protein
VAQLTNPPFHNLICTFSAEPEFFQVPEGSLSAKFAAIRAMHWMMNTNFEAVFDNILKKAKSVNLAPEHMVKRVLVFSDMQFDEATKGQYNKTTHENLEAKFKNAGYTLPQIVYWNLRASVSGGLPVTRHTSGALLMSGYSGQLLKTIMSGGDLDMITLMLKAVSGGLYDKVQLAKE